jgi:hypothetical protein
MSIAPTLQRYLTAENIQYDVIPHDPTMSSARTAEACRISQPEVYMEAGDHQTLLHISHAQLARLMGNARHGRFSKKLPHSISSSIVWG